MPDPTAQQLNLVRQQKAWCRKHPWDGRAPTMEHCRRLAQVAAATDPEMRTNLLLTFDSGYHVSGWWRNADYDSCWHLSLSWPTPGVSWLTDPNQKPSYEEIPKAEVDFWLALYFDSFSRWVWHEPGGAARDRRDAQGVSSYKNIQHFRLFVDKPTMQPILPVGEVYELRRWTPETPPKVDR
jgi:hypothetical protein